MTPLQVVLNLKVLRNWSLRSITDPSGNKCVHICIPVQENGVNITTADGGSDIDGSEVMGVSWNFLATPATPKNKKDSLYCLIPSMSKYNWQACLDRGLVDPERKNFHQVCGSIKPWPYSTKRKSTKKA